MSESGYAWKRFVQLKFGVDTSAVQQQVQSATNSIAASASAATDSAVVSTTEMAATVATAGAAIASVLSTIGAAATTAWGYAQTGFDAASTTAVSFSSSIHSVFNSLSDSVSSGVTNINRLLKSLDDVIDTSNKMFGYFQDGAKIYAEVFTVNYINNALKDIKSFYNIAKLSAMDAAAAFTLVGIAVVKGTDALIDMTEAAMLNNIALTEAGASIYTLSASGASILQDIGRETKTSIGEISSAVSSMEDTIFSATSAENYGKDNVFTELGLDASKFISMGTEETLVAITKAIDSYADGTQKAAIATKIFGSDSESTLQFLRNVSKESEEVLSSTNKSIDTQIVGLSNISKSYSNNMVESINNIDMAWAKVTDLFNIDKITNWSSSFFASTKPIKDSLIPIFLDLSEVIKETTSAIYEMIPSWGDVSSRSNRFKDEIESVAIGIRAAGMMIVDGLSYVADALHGFYITAKTVFGGVATVYQSLVQFVSSGGEVISKALTGDFSGAASAAKTLVLNQKDIYKGAIEGIDESIMKAKSWGDSMREIVGKSRFNAGYKVSEKKIGEDLVPENPITAEQIIDPKVLSALAALEQKVIDVGKAIALSSVSLDTQQNEALNTLKLQSDAEYQNQKMALAQRSYELEREYITTAMDANNRAMADKRLGEEEIYKIAAKQLDLAQKLQGEEVKLAQAVVNRWTATQQAAEKARAEIQARLDLEIEAGATIEKSSSQYLQGATEKIAKETYLASITNQSAAVQKLLSAEYDIQLATKKELEKIAVSAASAEEKQLAGERILSAEKISMQGAEAVARRDELQGYEAQAKEVFTTVLTSGSNAFDVIGKKLKSAVVDQLAALAAKVFMVNVFGQVSGGGAAGGGGGGQNSLLGKVGSWASSMEVGGSTLGVIGNAVSSGFSQGFAGTASSFMGPVAPGFSAASALGEFAAAAGPYALAAVGLTAAINAFSDANQKKGGNYTLNAATGVITTGITGTHGVELGDASSQTLIQDGIKSVTKNVNALLKAAGSDVTVTSATGMSQWSSEKPESYAGSQLTLSSGVKVGQDFAKVDNNLGMATVEQTIAKYTQSLNLATSEAIKKVAEIPESAVAEIDKIDTMQGVETYAAAVQKVIESTMSGALAVEKFGVAGANVSVELARAWAGFDAAGLGKMMTDAAFNPAVGMSAAETFGVALGNSVQQSLLNNVMGQVQSSIYNSIIIPILAGQEVSQAATDAVINDAVAKLDKLAVLLDSEEFKGVIARISSATAPVMSSLAQFAPVASAAAVSTSAMASAAKEIDPAVKAAEDAIKKLNDTLGSLADKNASLQVDLLRAQGDDAAATKMAREQELTRLTAGMSNADAARVASAYAQNTALEDQITLIKTQKTAAEEVAKSSAESKKQAEEAIAAAQKSAAEEIANRQKVAEEAKSAAKTMLDAWQSITTTLEDEVARVRGVISAGTEESVAALQAKFVTATVAARAGDETAAKSLPGISQALLQAADETMTDTSRLSVLRGQVAAALEQTAMDSKSSAQQRYDSAIRAADSMFQFQSAPPVAIIPEYTPIVVASPVPAPAQTSPAPPIDGQLQAMADAINVLSDTITNRPLTVRTVNY